MLARWPGRLHERGVGSIDVRSSRYVFRDRVETQPGLAHALLQDWLAGKLMRKIAVLSQKFGMGQRSISQMVTPFQLVQPRFLALTVHQIKELLLTLRRPSLSGDGNDKCKACNRDNGPVHFQCTLYVRS
jgi:hypothetical protein